MTPDERLEIATHRLRGVYDQIVHPAEGLPPRWIEAQLTEILLVVVEAVQGKGGSEHGRDDPVPASDPRVSGAEDRAALTSAPPSTAPEGDAGPTAIVVTPAPHAPSTTSLRAVPATEALPVTTAGDDDWYRRAIAAKWNEPEVQRAILDILERHSQAGDCEDLPPIEDAVFGPRVECPNDCGSMNLPGAPTCWGCEEKL